ncbi:pyridoxal phosphate-dependent decarboxylase family protein [Aeromicrobium yanjiei]|uniref:Aminotransferase class V-fold PLP-dependent enzyme n=1 Tax=Aeromicrobium yanjiei TaxID=2662028 RepID=A0A5Q2MFC0_9ACTN|nr:aminotransferase class V-fold PLP-dependent enzyme [Aeromicrobium yanjiei]QGG40433.1 aminotransferase class V-fold PLP-dependent enzyme [Aeromicrobium yanjiei]
MSTDDLLRRLQQLRAHDLPTHGGRTLAYVYDSGLADTDELGKQALAMYASTNGLDPTAFPSLLAMEKDLVAFARPLFHGTADTVGTVTSGGTESILLAVQAARDARPVAAPVMIVPTTIHAAFAKASHYFGVERVAVDVDPVTRRADPVAMAAAMDAHRDRVVLVAASAPSYAHGVVDPIEAIAAETSARGLRFHVDACIGGWVLPWAERLGHDIGPWDFRVPGVTSLSADLHKYAYTPKGVSLLLHATPDLRRPQFFASADWPGYTMLNATTQSTKSGGPLAAAWAVVHLIGDDGYLDLVRTTLAGTAALVAGVEEQPHVRLVTRPDSSLVTLETDTACDVFTLSDEMLAHGWFVQPQMSFRDMPASLHLTVCAATAPAVPEFLTALAESVDAAVAAGPIVVDEDLREAAVSIDPATLDDAAFDGLLSLAGLGSGTGEVTVPDRMAPVNALLDVAPPALREALLIAFLDRLSR